MKNAVAQRYGEKVAANPPSASPPYNLCPLILVLFQCNSFHTAKMLRIQNTELAAIS